MNLGMKILSTVLISISLLSSSTLIYTALADPLDSFPYEPSDDIIINALNFLRNRQKSDGNIGGFAVSAWAAIAITSAGEDIDDWGDLSNYLEENIDLIETSKATDWQRHALAIAAINEDPRDFNNINFIEKIKKFYDGEQIGISSILYDDIFGI